MWLNTSVVKGVHMNPKEYQLLPFLDLKFEKYKISPRLVRILIDLAVDHQREDTRHLNFPHTDL